MGRRRCPLRQNTPTPAAEDITLALVNGKIHTVDTANTVANTATIRNGRFVTVGEPKPKSGAGVRVIICAAAL